MQVRVTLFFYNTVLLLLWKMVDDWSVQVLNCAHTRIKICLSQTYSKDEFSYKLCLFDGFFCFDSSLLLFFGVAFFNSASLAKNWTPYIPKQHLDGFVRCWLASLRFQYFCSNVWTLCSYSAVVYSYQICYRVLLQFFSKKFSLARLLTTVSESLCGLNDSIKKLISFALVHCLLGGLVILYSVIWSCLAPAHLFVC